MTFFRFLGTMGDILCSGTIPGSKFFRVTTDRPKLAKKCHFTQNGHFWDFVQNRSAMWSRRNVRNPSFSLAFYGPTPPRYRIRVPGRGTRGPIYETSAQRSLRSSELRLEFHERLPSSGTHETYGTTHNTSDILTAAVSRNAAE